MNQELLEELKVCLKDLNISGLENIDLLSQLTSKDIINQTELSYQVTPILKKLLEYANIHIYIDAEEQTELFSMNQTNFFSKVLNITRLSEEILSNLFILGILHPVLDVKIEFDDVTDSQEDCMGILSEIQDIVEKESNINKNIELYHRKTVGIYQQKFIEIVLPILKQDMLENNYEGALNLLSEYTKMKLNFISGMECESYFIMTKICQKLHNMLNPECIDYLTDLIEDEILDIGELDDEEYFNLLILQFENRYLREKSCHYYYREKEEIMSQYLEKCKKM